jgi:hypothetical protein
VERDVRLGFWWRWLVVVTIVALLLGICFVVLPGLTQTIFNVLFFSGRPLDVGALAARYIAFTTAVLGAVLVGWAAALLGVLFGPFRAGRREGWLIVAISLVAWYVPDTGASLWYGFWPNAVLNSVLAVAFLIPLAATRGMLRSPEA